LAHDITPAFNTTQPFILANQEPVAPLALCSTARKLRFGAVGSNETLNCTNLGARITHALTTILGFYPPSDSISGLRFTIQNHLRGVFDHFTGLFKTPASRSSIEMVARFGLQRVKSVVFQLTGHLTPLTTPQLSSVAHSYHSLLLSRASRSAPLPWDATSVPPLSRTAKELLEIKPASLFEVFQELYSLVVDWVRADLVPSVWYVTMNTYDRVLGVAISHANTTVAGVILIVAWGVVLHHTVTEGLGLIELFFELRSKTHFSPGSSALGGVGLSLLDVLLCPCMRTRFFMRPYRHGRWVKSTKWVYSPHNTTKYVAAYSSFMRRVRLEVEEELEAFRTKHTMHRMTQRILHRTTVLCTMFALASIALAFALIALTSIDDTTPQAFATCPMGKIMHHLHMTAKTAKITAKTGSYFAVFHAQIFAQSLLSFLTNITEQTSNLIAPLMNSIYHLEQSIRITMTALSPMLYFCHPEGVLSRAPVAYEHFCNTLPMAVVTRITRINMLLKSLAPARWLHFSIASTCTAHPMFANTTLASTYAPRTTRAYTPLDTCRTPHYMHDSAHFTSSPAQNWGGSSPAAGLVISQSIICTVALLCIPPARVLLHDCLKHFCAVFAVVCCRVLKCLSPCLVRCCHIMQAYCVLLVCVMTGLSMSWSWPVVSTYPLFVLTHWSALSCIMWMCTCMLFTFGQPKSAHMFWSITKHISHSRVGCIAYCALFTAFALAEIVLSTVPRVLLSTLLPYPAVTYVITGGALLTLLTVLTVLSYHMYGRTDSTNAANPTVTLPVTQTACATAAVKTPETAACNPAAHNPAKLGSYNSTDSNADNMVCNYQADNSAATTDKR
jgi:hypothetical protein